LHLVLRLRGGMYDITSGRHGFEVLEDGSIVFPQIGEVVHFSDNLTLNGHDGQAYRFHSQEELVRFLEEKHISVLLNDFESAQKDNDSLEAEIARWMPS